MAPPMEERRSEPRSRTLLAGKIALQGGGVIDCTLRNRSPSGARLRVASVVGIPDHFTLLLELQGERRRPGSPGASRVRSASISSTNQPLRTGGLADLEDGEAVGGRHRQGLHRRQRRDADHPVVPEAVQAHPPGRTREAKLHRPRRDVRARRPGVPVPSVDSEPDREQQGAVRPLEARRHQVGHATGSTTPMRSRDAVASSARSPNRRIRLRTAAKDGLGLPSCAIRPNRLSGSASPPSKDEISSYR